MIRTVQPGKARFTPPMWGPKFGRGISRVVVFDSSCGYDLEDEDQDDWNKLFGIMPIGFKNHQYTSYRFGWRYNILTRKIELAAYIYQKGKPIRQFLKAIHFNRPVHCELIQLGNMVHFLIDGISYYHLIGQLPLIGWRLGPYFGGNEKATHEMHIGIYHPKKFNDGNQRTSVKEVRRA